MLRQAATNAVTSAGVGFTLGTSGALVSGKSLGASLGDELRGGAQGFAMHMENPDRYVPVRISQEGILSTPGVSDPQGSPALMHHTIMWKNETPYNLEIFNHEGTNIIRHFKYYHIKTK